jgi:hypothetical protein
VENQVTNTYAPNRSHTFKYLGKSLPSPSESLRKRGARDLRLALPIALLLLVVLIKHQNPCRQHNTKEPQYTILVSLEKSFLAAFDALHYCTEPPDRFCHLAQRRLPYSFLNLLNSTWIKIRQVLLLLLLSVLVLVLVLAEVFTMSMMLTTTTTTTTNINVDD